MGEASQECLESHPCALSLGCYLRDCFVHKGMLFLEAESFGGGDYVSDIGFPSFISIQIKQFKEDLNLINSEYRVLGDYIFGKCGSPVFLNRVSSHVATHFCTST